MREATLPSWAKALSPGKIEILADKFYPEILKELWADENWPDNLPEDDSEYFKEEVLKAIDGKVYADKMFNGLQRGDIDQYWLEVAFQCAKMDIQSAVSGTELMPKKGGGLCIFVKDTTKADNNGVSLYAQKSAPFGRGTDAATKGKEGRMHYNRIRAVLI